MNFLELHRDINCNCINGAKEDALSTYCLKANREIIREGDFKTKWEKGERPQKNDCNLICSKKGKSVTLVTENNFLEIFEIFKQLFPISPKYKPFILKIKFSDNTGIVKPTPSINNPYHFDFYKCDNFQFSNIRLVEAISLADNV